MDMRAGRSLRHRESCRRQGKWDYIVGVRKCCLESLLKMKVVRIRPERF